MKWKKEILLIILGLVILKMSSGITTNITEFDDGCSNCNISSNLSSFVTFPSTVTVLVANLSLRGYFNESNQTSGKILNPSWELGSGSLPQNWSISYLGSGGDCCPIVNRTSVDLDGCNFAPQQFIFDGANTLISKFEGNNQGRINSINQTGVDMTNVDIMRITYRHRNNQQDDFLVNLNGSQIYSDTLESGADTTMSVDINVTNYSGAYNLEFRHTINGGGSNADSCLSLDNIRFFKTTYPQNVSIWINNTRVFNEPGNLSNINASINLNATMINNTVSGNSILPINFTATYFGVLNVYNITFIYNRTLNAILSFNSPAQVTQSISSGASFTQLVNLSNTGNYNATNISFETISQSATPNLNDSITDDCVNVTNTSSIVCNVTFSSITQSAEPDEKLRVRAIGTDVNDLVFSSSIDLDVTVTAPASNGGGGGGGQPSKCEWRVFRPANRVINALGYFGYKTAPISFQVYNNESQPVLFTYFTQGVSCKLEKSTELIQGSSFGLNTIQCDYPVKKDTGQIIILGGQCSQSIDVKLSSSELGLGLTFLSGGAGIIPALLLYGVGALGLIFLFKIIQ